jgi:uncharacterized protein (DUF4415 family)
MDDTWRRAPRKSHPISALAGGPCGPFNASKVCYKPGMTRRTIDTRSAAEKAFKAATTKPPEAPPKPPPSLPGAKEMVSLRIDRDVLDFFQEDGPGWQDRINAALRKAAGK